LALSRSLLAGLFWRLVGIPALRGPSIRLNRYGR
jgi:hypothetical protein